jgi:predicted lipid-binding transport protein (Tim44 family)
MRLHLPRQASGSCSPGKVFYLCDKGPYTGCCSTNPCDTGVCGDETISKTTTAKTSKTASKSSPATRSASSLTSTASSRSTATQHSATSTPTSAVTSPTPYPDQNTSPPVGAIVGGVLGGLALLALVAALLWWCLQRKSKLRIRIGRGKKKVDDQREGELLEAKAAILDREKFLDAARQRSALEAKSQDPFAEFGGSSSYPKTSTATPPPRWN